MQDNSSLLNDSHGILFYLAGLGAAIGLGQLLMSNEVITIRRAAGRAVVTGGLSVAAAAILSYWPTTPLIAVVGVGAAVASLGTTGLESLFQKYLSKQ